MHTTARAARVRAVEVATDASCPAAGPLSVAGLAHVLVCGAGRRWRHAGGVLVPCGVPGGCGDEGQEGEGGLNGASPAPPLTTSRRGHCGWDGYVVTKQNRLFDCSSRPNIWGTERDIILFSLVVGDGDGSAGEASQKMPWGLEVLLMVARRQHRSGVMPPQRVVICFSIEQTYVAHAAAV